MEKLSKNSNEDKKERGKYFVEISNNLTQIGERILYTLTCGECGLQWMVEGNDDDALESAVRHEEKPCKEHIVRYPKESIVLDYNDTKKLEKMKTHACEKNCKVDHVKERLLFLGYKLSDIACPTHSKLYEQHC